MHFYSSNESLSSDVQLHLNPVGDPWLRGDGLFETIKSEKGVLFFLDRHLLRLRQSAASLKFARYDETGMRAEIAKLLAESSEISRGRFRITLFSNGEYLLTHESAPLRVAPQKLLVSPFVRFSQSLLTGKKSLSYGEGSAGLRIAASSGCDDLLYLNEGGEVVETGIANILIENRGTFFTPRVESGCLPGIVRGVLLDWFKEVKEEALTLADVKSATGLYVISSMREIDLVTELHHANGTVQKFQITAEAEKLRGHYLINSRSMPNS
jgi:branched-chain amino acid aminotransferase